MFLELFERLVVAVERIARAYEQGQGSGRQIRMRGKRGPKPVGADEIQPTEMDRAAAKRALRRNGSVEI